MPEFMRPSIEHFAAFEVETSHGTELVPCDLVGESPDLQTLAEYCEGAPREDPEPEKVTGFFWRLSAPGYMDCTEWTGPFRTESDAMRDLARTHEDFDATHLLCEDCHVLASAGDATGFDYHHGPDESAARLAECESGLTALGPDLVPVGAWSDHEFSGFACDCCGSELSGARYGYRVIDR